MQNSHSLFSLVFFLILLYGCDDSQQEPTQVSLVSALGNSAEQDLTRYRQAIAIRPFSFPEDHSAHPGFKNEWWYFTGNLKTQDGRRFGYQATFFRIALRPDIAERPSAWATHQIWMAHMALSDFETGEHLTAQRFARDALGFAGSSASGLKIWLEDWQLELSPDGMIWSLALKEKSFSFDLQMVPLKAVVLQGDQGLSKKGNAPGNASYYYSIPRLETRGSLTINGAQHMVQGDSWLDREWGSSALEEGQVGWDWFSLQFDSGEELMYYQIHRRGGVPDGNGHGSWVAQEGSVSPLGSEQIQLQPIRYWVSEQGERFPVSWRLSWPERDKAWLIEAVFDDQLMEMAVRYWEGAVTATEVASGRVVGRGYLEMTGY